VLDDCDNPISNTTGVNVTFNIFYNDTYPPAAFRTCTDVHYMSDGYYYCIWDSNSFDNGTYSVRMNATNVTLHNNGTFMEYGSFGLGLPPNTPRSFLPGT